MRREIRAEPGVFELEVHRRCTAPAVRGLVPETHATSPGGVRVLSDVVVVVVRGDVERGEEIGGGGGGERGDGR